MQTTIHLPNNEQDNEQTQIPTQTPVTPSPQRRKQAPSLGWRKQQSKRKNRGTLVSLTLLYHWKLWTTATSREEKA